MQGPQPMTGRIMAAERFNETIPGSPGQPPLVVPRTRVTLMSPQGLRQFVLEDAAGVQVSNPALRADIDRALEAARAQASQTMRHITLRSTGTGPRTVRVGYVVAVPLWKATYRLVLPAKPGDKARLQGWAVLENQSGADWNNVALTLQYGNPVTFRQAIYRSYYVQRPEVPVEVLGRILPGVDTGARPFAGAAMNRALPGGFAAMAAAPAPMAQKAMRRRPSWHSPASWPPRPKAPKKPCSSFRRRSFCRPVTPPACRSSTARSRRSVWTSPPATIRIRFPRCGSATTRAAACRPGCWRCMTRPGR